MSIAVNTPWKKLFLLCVFSLLPLEVCTGGSRALGKAFPKKSSVALWVSPLEFSSCSLPSPGRFVQEVWKAGVPGLG